MQTARFEKTFFILRFVKSNPMESCALTSKILQNTFNTGSNLRKYELVRNGAEMLFLRKKKKIYFPSTFGGEKNSVLQVKWVYCHLKFSNSKQW